MHANMEHWWESCLPTSSLWSPSIFGKLLSHCYWLPIEKILPLGHSGNIGAKSFAEAWCLNFVMFKRCICPWFRNLSRFSPSAKLHLPVGFSCPLWYIAPVTGTTVIVSRTMSVSAILNYATWLKQTFQRFLVQLVTIIISKIISSDTQERKKNYILGTRKVKKTYYWK